MQRDIFPVVVVVSPRHKDERLFREQLSLKQNAESFKHALNQNEFKACMKMKAAKFQCNFHVELIISKD